MVDLLASLVASNLIRLRGGIHRLLTMPVYSREETEFLPAALEIIETPPSPIGRAIAATIAASFAVALAWSCIGKIDIVATAQGKIIPTGRSKVIQPFEGGVIHAIHVHEGQAVKAGDVLIELDPTMNGADRDRLSSELASARLEAARLRAALSDENALTAFNPPAESPPETVQVQRQILVNQVSEYHAKLAALDQQKAQRNADRAAIDATIQKLNAAIEVMGQRVEIRRQAAETLYGSKLNYLIELQGFSESQHELEVQRHRLVESEAALAGLTELRREAEAEFKRTVFNELNDAKQKAEQLEQELIKAQERTRLQRLAAPEDGVIQQLAVTTVGGVVTAAQTLMVLVPADSRIEIEALVKNQDIGFVQPGQAAEVKIETFNFTKYGLMHGRVQDVSADAILRDRPAQAASGTVQTANLTGQDLVYAAHLTLDRATIAVDGKEVGLSPGMAVTAEIKTGERRLIEFLLSPLLRYRHEAMRER